MQNEKWVLCPVCGNKTRIKIRENTVLLNFPLFTNNRHQRARRIRCRADEQVSNRSLSALFLYNHR